MSCNFLLYHWFLFSLLSKVTISLVANSCLTEICRQHGPLGVQDFGIKLQPGYQLACSIYRIISIQGRHENILCRKLIVGEQPANLSPNFIKMAAISHKIMDTWRSIAVELKYLMSPHVSETPKSDTSGGHSWRLVAVN